MDTDNRVVRVGVWGLGAGRRGTKRRAMGNMYNNINNKKKKKQLDVPTRHKEQGKEEIIIYF